MSRFKQFIGWLALCLGSTHNYTLIYSTFWCHKLLCQTGFFSMFVWNFFQPLFPERVFSRLVLGNWKQNGETPLSRINHSLTNLHLHTHTHALWCEGERAAPLTGSVGGSSRKPCVKWRLRAKMPIYGVTYVRQEGNNPTLGRLQRQAAADRRDHRRQRGYVTGKCNNKPLNKKQHQHVSVSSVHLLKYIYCTSKKRQARQAQPDKQITYINITNRNSI